MKPNRVMVAAVVLCMPMPVFAYIDPGSGMLLWQGAIAAVGAGLVFLRDPLQGIKRLWKRIRRK